MKRFALVSDIIGTSFMGWDYVVENFDILSFKVHEGLDFLKPYELIWVYSGLAGDDILARKIREIAPTAKILFQFDNDGGYYKLSDYIRNNIVPHVTGLVRLTLKDWTGVRNYYLQIPREKGPWWSMEMVRPYRIDEKEKQDYGAIMFHGNSIIIDSLKVVKEAGLKVKLFANFHGVPATRNQEILNKYSLNDSIAYARLPEPAYFRELAQCKWALEDPDGSSTLSRFVIECASLGIPVVGGEQIYSVKIGYPETCTEHMDIPKQVSLIKALSQDPALCKRIGDTGYENLSKHLSNERCTQDLLDAMKDMEISP